MDAVEEELGFKRGDDFDSAPDAVKLWLALDLIGSLTEIKHPALTGLMQYQVAAAAYIRHGIYRWDDDGNLVKVERNGNELVEAPEQPATGCRSKESD